MISMFRPYIVSAAIVTTIAFSAILSTTSSVAEETVARPNITIGPYLQRVTSTSAIVCWTASGSTVTSLEYGKDERYGTIVSSQPEENIQCAGLTALQPYTRYHYRIVANGEALIPAASFLTLAGPDQESVTFVSWGDNRTNEAVHRSLSDAVAEINPDFVLNVGDVVESGNKLNEWSAFFRAEKKLVSQAPIFPVLGNHEANSPLYFSFLNPPGNKRWYSFDSGPVHVVALDVVFSPYHPGSPQYTWLENDLRQSKQPWKLVLAHYPVYSYANGRGDGTAEMQTFLVPLFERYGVQVAFGGHNHFYQRNIVNGINYVTTGGGGAPLHPVARGDSTVYAESTHHFLRLTASRRSLFVDARRLDGSGLDKFTLSLANAASVPAGPAETLDAAPSSASSVDWVDRQDVVASATSAATAIESHAAPSAMATVASGGSRDAVSTAAAAPVDSQEGGQSVVANGTLVRDGYSYIQGILKLDSSSPWFQATGITFLVLAVPLVARRVRRRSMRGGEKCLELD